MSDPLPAATVAGSYPADKNASAASISVPGLTPGSADCPAIQVRPRSMRSAGVRKRGVSASPKSASAVLYALA